MRRYNIILGILLILSIIDFALAAPVLLVQEKRQAGVDVVRMPKDVIFVLGKRGLENLDKLLEDFFYPGVRPIDSSDAHASSSSAPAGPDHGSTSVVQASGPNSASSTANPSLLMEPPGPSWVQGWWGSPSEYHWSQEGDDGFFANEPLFNSWSSASDYGSDHEWAVPGLRPNPDPNEDPDIDWEYWMNFLHPPAPGPSLPKEIGLPPEDQVGTQKEIGLTPEHQQHPSHPNLPSEPDSYRDLMTAHRPPPIEIPTESYSYSHPGEVPHPLSSGAGPESSTVPEHKMAPPSDSPNLGSPTEPEKEVAPGSPPTPSTDPELPLDDQSLSAADLAAADSQPPDHQAAI
jgi:hypothetical protein